MHLKADLRSEPRSAEKGHLAPGFLGRTGLGPGFRRRGGLVRFAGPEALARTVSRLDSGWRGREKGLRIRHRERSKRARRGSLSIKNL